MQIDILMCAISLIIAFILTLIGSYWIDKLYAMPNAPLSFPDEIDRRSRLRKPVLLIAICTLIYYFAQLNLPEFIYLLLAVFFLLLITMTDFEQYVIFDRMLLPFAIIGCIAAFHLNLSIYDHAIAALAGGGVLLLIAILTKGAIGGGDIKLIAVIGIWFGTDRLFTILIIGFILGGIAAFIMLLTKQKERKSYFAYGPYFALTAIFILCIFNNLE